MPLVVRAHPRPPVQARALVLGRSGRLFAWVTERLSTDPASGEGVGEGTGLVSESLDLIPEPYDQPQLFPTLHVACAREEDRPDPRVDQLDPERWPTPNSLVAADQQPASLPDDWDPLRVLRAEGNRAANVAGVNDIVTYCGQGLTKVYRVLVHIEPGFSGHRRQAAAARLSNLMAASTSEGSRS